MENLFLWAKQNGAYINPKLDLDKDDKFINKETIQLDEILIKLPKKNFTFR